MNEKDLAVVNGDYDVIEREIDRVPVIEQERRIDLYMRLSEKLEVPDLKTIAENPDRFISYQKNILKVMVLKTNPRDWIDRNGFPELQGSGGWAIRQALGISFFWTVKPHVEKNEATGHRYATCEGLFFHKQLGILEEMGARSTEDDFVKDWTDDNLKKCAIANLFSRGLLRLVGISKLTWADLAVIDPRYSPTGASKIEHTKGKKGGSIATEWTEGEKKMARDIWAICMEIGGHNPVAAADTLERLTTWKIPEGKPNAGKEIKGVRDVNLIPGKGMGYKLTDAKKLYKETFDRAFVYKETDDGKTGNGPDGYDEAFNREPGDDGLFTEKPGK